MYDLYKSFEFCFEKRTWALWAREAFVDASLYRKRSKVHRKRSKVFYLRVEAVIEWRHHSGGHVAVVQSQGVAELVDRHLEQVNAVAGALSPALRIVKVCVTAKVREECVRQHLVNISQPTFNQQKKRR